MIDVDLLKILCCPETHQDLRLASNELVEDLNARAAQGKLRNRSGAVVTEKLEGLIRADGAALYLVRNGIPVLLVDEAIPLAQ